MSSDKLKIAEQRKVFGKVTIIIFILIICVGFLTTIYYPSKFDDVMFLCDSMLFIVFGVYMGLRFAEKVLRNDN